MKFTPEIIASVKQQIAAGPQWLQVMRLQQLAQFEGDDLPTIHHEDWKYTDTSVLQQQQYSLVGQQLLVTRGVDHYLLSVHAYQLVFVDGCFQPECSQIPDLPDGVIITNLQSACADHESLVRPLLEQEFSAGQLFTELNSAFLGDGAFIYVPDSVELSLPICILNLTSGQDQPVMVNHTNLIVVGANAKATIFQNYRSSVVNIADTKAPFHATADHYFNNSTTKIQLGIGANVSLTKLQYENDATRHIANTQVWQRRDSQFHSVSVSLGAKLARDDFHCHLDESGATTQLYGFYLPREQQHIDHHTRIAHNVPNCTSREFYKGIAADNGRTVFNGKVLVVEDAQQTVAEQSNQNLLLSKRAEIDTKPELEIYADDVKCSHGATIGQLDPNQVFYLRSRGIPWQQAISLLTQAFATEILEQIEHPAIYEYVQARVVRQLDEVKHEF